MQGGTVTFPEELVKGEDIECMLMSGRRVFLRAYHTYFNACLQRPTIGLDRAYSAKPFVIVEKQVMFPEIALLDLFRKNGWQGAWADSLHRKYFDKMPNQSKGISLSTYANKVIARIAENNDKSKNGCWDIILWTERAVVFVAVVDAFSRKDISDAHTRWLAAALRSGLSATQFVVIAWGYRKVVAKRKRRGLS
ncbi:MAG: hypothetical protein ABSF77_13675 [Spirochaetia bacterium]|jgi:hypothetical protein